MKRPNWKLIAITILVVALLAALKCSLPSECSGENVPRYCVEN